MLVCASSAGRCFNCDALLLKVSAMDVQGCVPFWPSVLAQLTGFSEGGYAPFTQAISLAEVTCDKLLLTPDVPYGY